VIKRFYNRKERFCWGI